MSTIFEVCKRNSSQNTTQSLKSSNGTATKSQLIYLHAQPRVEVKMQRLAETRNVASKKRDGTKARDIYKQYPKGKADDLIKRLREKNLWAYDEDFDGDSEDW